MGGQFFGDFADRGWLAIVLGVARASVYEWADTVKHKTLCTLNYRTSLRKLWRIRSTKRSARSTQGRVQPDHRSHDAQLEACCVETAKTDVTSDGQADPESGLSTDDHRTEEARTGKWWSQSPRLFSSRHAKELARRLLYDSFQLKYPSATRTIVSI